MENKKEKNIFIPEDVKIILKELESKGFSAYIVGGCVRDSFMGKQPHDYDICTSAKPEEIKEVFKGYDVIETGIKHGTLTVKGMEDFYEVTTYRIDGEYKDSRHPEKVIFVDDIESDLARRDFTINAMAYNETKGLIDPFGGQIDLMRKTIRCVGNPDKRFNEDALRIMRAVRFASVLGFRVEQNTSTSMHKNAYLLKNISEERKNIEFCKMIRTANVELLREYRDVFAEFIPEIKETFDFNQNNFHHQYDIYEHTIHAVSNAPQDLIVRLALFFHDIGKPQVYTVDENGVGHFYGHAAESEEITKNVMRRMKFDNSTIKTVSELVLNHDTVFTDEIKFARRMLNRLGEEQVRRLIEVESADKSAQTQNKDSIETERILKETKKNIEKVIEENNCISLKNLAINGNDLKTIGIKEGKYMGEVLKSLLNNIIENPENNSKEKLLSMAEKMKERKEL